MKLKKPLTMRKKHKTKPEVPSNVKVYADVPNAEQEVEIKEFLIGMKFHGFELSEFDILEAAYTVSRCSARHFLKSKKWRDWLEIFKRKNSDILESTEDFESNWLTNTACCVDSKCPGDFILAEESRNFYLTEYRNKIQEKPREKFVSTISVCSPNGKMLEPVLVYPLNKIPAKVYEELPMEWGVIGSADGILESDVWGDYLCNIFYQKLKEMETKFPIVFYLPHHIKISYIVSKKCEFLGIILISLPKNHQNLEPLARSIKQVIRQLKKISRYFPYESYAGILKKVIANKTFEDAIRCNFRNSLLFPFGGEEKVEAEEETRKNLPIERFLELIGPERTLKYAQYPFNTSFQNEEDKILFSIFQELTDRPQEIQISNVESAVANFQQEDFQCIICFEQHSTMESLGRHLKTHSDDQNQNLETEDDDCFFDAVEEQPDVDFIKLKVKEELLQQRL